MKIFNARFLNYFLDECKWVLSTKLLTAALSDIEIQKKNKKNIHGTGKYWGKKKRGSVAFLNFLNLYFKNYESMFRYKVITCFGNSIIAIGFTIFLSF